MQQYRGFPLSELKNVSVTSVGTKNFVLIMKAFSIVSKVERFHCSTIIKYTQVHCICMHILHNDTTIGVRVIDETIEVPGNLI